MRPPDGGQLAMFVDNPKHEIRNAKQIRISKSRIPKRGIP